MTSIFGHMVIFSYLLFSIFFGHLVSAFSTSSIHFTLFQLLLLFTGRHSKDLNKLWDPVLLESARGSQIYRWAEREETADDAAAISVKSFLRQTTGNYCIFFHLLGL